MSIYKNFILFFICCLGFTNARAEDYGYTARGLFMMLPTSIFESTPEGLGEREKQELLAKGKSEYWEISGESPDMLVFTALPFRDSSVGLRVFRNDKNGGAEVAIGTLGEPVCALELWRMDSSGRLMPVDTPDEPSLGEFFSREHQFPKNIKFSVLMCLGQGGLEARPLFWNDNGMLPACVENRIYYEWTGNTFKKTVLAAQ